MFLKQTQHLLLSIKLVIAELDYLRLCKSKMQYTSECLLNIFYNDNNLKDEQGNQVRMKILLSRTIFPKIFC